MTALLELLRNVIEKQGPVSVADYMNLALQHPEFGYYAQHDPLGKDGDFTTAPEISQMFGEMIGLWCADIWREMGRPSEFVLLELGPGRGTLMQDALRATAKLNGFHPAMKLRLLESNQTLRVIQRERLADNSPDYIDDLSKLPELPIIVIANEFFDALPIRQFEKNFQGWCERLVTVVEGKLAFTPWALEPALMPLIPKTLHDANPGTVYEVSLQSLSIMRGVADHIVRHNGAALVVDYGYVEPPGKPTFQAVSNHQYADVLERPGEVDLTAHVDFEMLKRAAAATEAAYFGPIGQGEFLESLGVQLRAAQLKQNATPEQSAGIDAALYRLTDGSEMGVLFKAMAITSPRFKSLPGF